MEQSYWVSVQEAANFLGCSLITIYRHTKSGKIPSKKIGTKVLIPRDYLLACDAKREVSP